MRILDLYKEAWEKHDENILRNIFHNDAKYYEKPFRKPFDGIEEILDYWRKNSEVQKNVKFSIQRAIKRNNQIVAEWICEFDRIDLGKHLILKGMMWIILDRNKIKHFAEYFTRGEEMWLPA